MERTVLRPSTITSRKYCRHSSPSVRNFWSSLRARIWTSFQFHRCSPTVRTRSGGRRCYGIWTWLNKSSCYWNLTNQPSYKKSSDMMVWCSSFTTPNSNLCAKPRIFRKYLIASDDSSRLVSWPASWWISRRTSTARRWQWTVFGSFGHTTWRMSRRMCLTAWWCVSSSSGSELSDEYFAVLGSVHGSVLYSID